MYPSFVDLTFLFAYTLISEYLYDCRLHPAAGACDEAWGSTSPIEGVHFF